MRAIRRVSRLLWDASIGRHSVVDELKEDPALADDGLIGFATVGTVVVGIATVELLPTLLAPVIAPILALAMAFILRLVTRIARHPATLAQTTATVTATSLPLLLIPIPVVGAPIGITLWLLAGIVMLQRITLARLDIAAVVTLISHALTLGALIAAGFAIEAVI